MLIQRGPEQIGKGVAHGWRLLASGMAVCALFACAPQPIPASKTGSPADVAPTATAIAIGAPLVADQSIDLVHMFDEENGWAVSDTRILRTVDGAKTWHDVSPKTGAPFGYAVSSYFLDNLQGWILVPNSDDRLRGILHRTADGGLTWSESAVPFGSGTLQFLDAKQGWVMADLGAGAGSMAVSILQTSDAGASWHQTYTNDPTRSGAGNSLPLGGLKDGMWAVSMQTAWVGGVTYAPGTVYLYQTADSGRTWTKSKVAGPPGYAEAELETTGPIFVTSSTGYLPVHVSSQNGILLATYVTHNGGSTWSLSPAFVPQGGVVDFVSETGGFAWNGSDFYATLDSAQTWKTISPDVAFATGFSGMDFVSLQVGYVLFEDRAGNRDVYKTRDGGATWNILGN